MIHPTVDNVELKLDLDALAALKEMKEAMQELGEKAVANAQRMAPVDTGQLRDSIAYEVDATGTLYVYAGVDYAAYVELGTRHMAPQPFLRPGLEAAVNGMNA